MMKMKKFLLCAILVVTAMLVTTNLHATALPWLDFGNNLIWNSTTNTLTDGGLALVDSVTYTDGTTVSIYSGDPVLGTATFPPLILYPVEAQLSLSFDGNNFNDYLRLVATDGSGTVWLDASLDIKGPAPTPLGSPNPYQVRIDSLVVDTGAGSQWAYEFDSALNYSLPYPAILNIGWTGGYFDLGGDEYQVNASGKVTIPEPGTLFLLGSGMLGVGVFARRLR